MRRLFHVPVGATSAVEADPADLDELASGGGWLWLDLTRSDAEELREAARVFRLAPAVVDDLLRPTKFPKVDDHDGHTFFVGHGIAGDEQRRLRTVEIDYVVGPDYLVSFCREDLPGVAWAREHVLQPGATDGVGPDRLFARLVEAGALRYQPLIDGLEERILELEEHAVAGHPSVPADVLALRRDALTLRQIAGPQRDALRVLTRDGMPAIGPAASSLLAGVHDHYFRITELIDSARSLLGGVLETYRSAIAERTNEVMKVLTVFSAIILPLSLMAGLYGMNFANMPELAWRWGYFALLGIMAAVAIALWAYFARRGFIGGPKLHRLPGVVGRGLVDLVKFTAKPALMLVGADRDDEQPPAEDEFPA